VLNGSARGSGGKELIFSFNGILIHTLGLVPTHLIRSADKTMRRAGSSTFAAAAASLEVTIVM
jgi:hypothetical protein